MNCCLENPAASLSLKAVEVPRRKGSALRGLVTTFNDVSPSFYGDVLIAPTIGDKTTKPATLTRYGSDRLWSEMQSKYSKQG
jgi:hypothetical protein